VCYQHSSHIKFKTQQLLGGKLTLPQPTPGQGSINLLSFSIWVRNHYDHLSCLHSEKGSSFADKHLVTTYILLKLESLRKGSSFPSKSHTGVWVVKNVCYLMLKMDTLHAFCIKKSFKLNYSSSMCKSWNQFPINWGHSNTTSPFFWRQFSHQGKPTVWHSGHRWNLFFSSRRTHGQTLSLRLLARFSK